MDHTAERIVHLLEIYPVLSPTLLQGALGPQTKAAHWKPILEDLIKTGDVKREFVVATPPSGRTHTYTLLSLNGVHQAKPKQATS